MHLAHALESNRNNSRAQLIAFRAAIKREDLVSAETALAEMQRTRPELLVLVADDIVSLFQKRGTPASAVEQLATAQQDAPSTLGLSRLIDASLKIEGRDQALLRLKQELANQPSVREAARLLELESNKYEEGAAQTMNEVAQLLHRATDRIPGFHCGHCGFRAPRYYWKCPGCNEWESFRATPLGQ